MPVVVKIFIACLVLQVLYYLVFFLRLNFLRGFQSTPENTTPVSVVICAKNEARYLKQYLKIVLIQQYPQFEVIVVNDESTDETMDVLVEYYKRNKNLKIVNIPIGTAKDLAGKKYALKKGLETASFDLIVVTDADCRPATTHWLSKMVGSYLYETKFVLGYSPYDLRPGLLNKVIRYENFMTTILSFGFAHAGLPYMGVGRNLSYKKSVFENFDGYQKSKNLMTGDDDLLVNATATGANTEICFDKDAYMFTPPKENWKEWLQQKKRHLRSGFKYKIHHSFLLFIFSTSLFGLYACAIYLAFTSQFNLWLLLAFGAVVALKFAISYRLLRRLSNKDLKFFSPVLDIAYSAYLLIIFFLLLLQPKDKWK